MQDAGVYRVPTPWQQWAKLRRGGTNPSGNTDHVDLCLLPEAPALYPSSMPTPTAEEMGPVAVMRVKINLVAFPRDGLYWSRVLHLPTNVASL